VAAGKLTGDCAFSHCRFSNTEEHEGHEEGTRTWFHPGFLLPFFVCFVDFVVNVCFQ